MRTEAGVIYDAPMTVLQAIFLAMIEGVTEFLPISSTGHLILTSKILGISPTEFTKSFNVFIQLGAIMAVATLYGKRLFANRRLWPILLTAFMPTAIVGFFLYPVIKDYLLESTSVTLIGLFVGGVVIIVIEETRRRGSLGSTKLGCHAGLACPPKWRDPASPWEWDSSSQAGMTKNRISPFEKLNLIKVLFIGLFQSLSVIPGVSRAAATTIGGMLVGLSRPAAVEFSFILALPTMLAATGLDLVKSGRFEGQEMMLLAVGFIISWITAMTAVQWLLRFVQRNSLIAFGVYRIALALVFWLLVQHE